MGSKPGNAIIGSLLAEYEGLHFMKDRVSDLTTNTDRITRHFKRKCGLSKSDYGQGEDARLPLAEGECLFWQVASRADRPRALALVRRKHS
jgi:hypothetical protein